MNLSYLEKPAYNPITVVPKTKQYPRHWVFTEDVIVELSDSRKIKIEKGFITDGASIPKWLWWFWKPIDEAFIGDAIHDFLWINKKIELAYFDYNISKARKFSDDERLKWRRAILPRKIFKNNITHGIIRLIGSFYYSKQFKIPV